MLFVKQSQDYIPVDFPWSNTHEELQYIQLSINNESAASLALHQLWRGKPRCTVLLEGEKKPYPAHERCVRLHVACIMCLCAQVWEEEHKFTPLINNKPACVGGLFGWFSLHIVSLVVLAQIFPCLTFDALLFFGWLCIDFHRFWHTAVKTQIITTTSSLPKIKGDWSSKCPPIHVHAVYINTWSHTSANMCSARNEGLADRPHQSHHRL